MARSPLGHPHHTIAHLPNSSACTATRQSKSKEKKTHLAAGPTTHRQVSEGTLFGTLKPAGDDGVQRDGEQKGVGTLGRVSLLQPRRAGVVAVGMRGRKLTSQQTAALLCGCGKEPREHAVAAATIKLSRPPQKKGVNRMRGCQSLASLLIKSRPQTPLLA